MSHSNSASLASAELADWKSHIADAYDRSAARYDRERSVSRSVEFFFDTTYAAIDRLMGPVAASAVHLDMPVGTGRFLFHLRDRGRRHHMLGIDIAAGMLAVTQQGAARRGEALPLSFGDAFRLPLASASIDLITSLRFFHLFPKSSWPAILAEMQRVLRPGGFVIVELRNFFRALAGGQVKEYRDRWLRGDHAHSFVLPGELRALFGGWANVELRGAGLDGLGGVATIAPRLARNLHEVTRWPVVRRLTKELLVKACKAPSK